ncbi:MAG: AAA family ATPase [Salinivirgaceae bacterium]|nr:AAA family ATPase [Salinivirgaceae bacterium]
MALFRKSESIREDLAQNEQRLSCVPTKIGMLELKTANKTIEEAKLKPDPVRLWDTLWYEGELCCLYADSNVGKSIYAIQIATQIAKNQKVLYFDFELSDKQFQLRYTDEDGKSFKFPENLFRVSLSKERIDYNDFENSLIANIEQVALQVDAKILIIDNITYLCCESEKGGLAGRLMMRLVELKKKYNFSILVLAHTPKRDMTKPITQNHLAGSKKLFNFFDSSFVVAFSAKNKNLRYIKQLKVRDGEFNLDSDNIMVCAIEKRNSLLQFVPLGFSSEREHLVARQELGDKEVNEKIKQYSSEGYTQREIADLVGVSPSTVNRRLNQDS